MTPDEVISVVQTVRRPAASAQRAVQRHLDNLTKPVGSLGEMERIAARLARIYGDPPPPLDRRAVFVMAGDHGVTLHGVSAYPSEVTGQMCRVIDEGRAAVSVFARAVNAEVIAVNVGVEAAHSFSNVIDCCVRRGTVDLVSGDAMTADDAAAAFTAGFNVARARMNDFDIIATGEIGIGNTTVAAALTAAVLRVPVSAVIGPGTGIGTDALERKRSAVERGLKRIDPADGVFTILCRVGGLEIAAIVGVITAGALAGRAVVLDGFVGTAGAIVAHALNPELRHYCFASHLSPEPGHRVQLRHLGLRPLLRLGMRLGEGTGALLALPIIAAAGRLLRDMATFEDGRVSGKAVS